ncbi:MAG: hypothetical protein M3P33_01360, partial [bacterium]|nr:hypothetical protein [bacterium]
MAKDINLLPDVALKEEKQAKLQKLLTISSMAILLVGLLAVLAIYTIYFTTKKDVDKIKASNTTLEENLNTYATTEILYRGITVKQTAAIGILKLAKDYKTIVEEIQNLIPDGIVVSDIQIDKSDKITLNAKANTSSSFDQYISNLLSSDKGGKNFSNVSIGSISG